MPPRKRKVPEKATSDDNVFDSPSESQKNDKAERKRKLQKKKSSTEGETVTSPQPTEKHVVVKILVNAQSNEAFHSKYIKELTNQYAKIGHDEFLAMFISCLKQLIEKDESVAKYANIGLLFMAKFATSLSDEDSDDMHKFLEAVFDWVLKTVSLSHNIRARLCGFVNSLLDSLGSNASLDDTLFDNILKYMFDRLKDMYPSVRVQAIRALQRLQMPDDPDDPIVKIYTFHLASDPSGPVRQAVLTCLGRNIHTIPVILERLWDIDERVRRHVYVHMANYPVKTYKVIHRLTFLEQGLNDRSDSVRKVVTSIMIPQWLESYNKNYLAFLSGLKLDASEAEIDRFRAIARLALPEIFRTQNPEDLIATLSLDVEENSPQLKCIPFDKLTIESSMFWCSLIVFFQQDERRSDYLERVIPELSIFCKYVEKYNDTIIGEDKEPWEIMIAQSILFNLIEILISFDYGDEIGRQCLRTLAVHLLTTNPCNEQIIKSLINICEKLIPSSDDRLQVYVDVIRSLVDQDLLEKSLNFMDPNVVEAMEKDPNLNLQVSALKLKLFELKEEESKFVKVKDFARVSCIAEDIALTQDRLVALIRPFMTGGSTSLQQKRVTKELQIKALKLAFHGVCSKNVTKLNPAMCQLYTDFIRLKIESSDMDVRNWALKCGATFSLLYEQLAKDVFVALNKQFFDHHHTDVWTTSVGAMFQLIDRYGFSYFDEDPNGEAGEKQKEKPKKSRLLYNTTEYADDPEDDSTIEKENVTIKGLIYLFGHFMDTCDDIHLMSALIDGFGLLILHGLYVDEKLVSRLILLYFNPTTEAEVNQILSIFFETLIHHKKQECLEAALIQTLTKIIEASNESPLHEVKIETVLRFIISSTLPVYCKAGAKIHDNIALSLLKWMKTNAANRDVLKIASKEILSLDISDDNAVRQTSQEYVDDLLEMPMDSKTEKNLKSFNERMKGNCPAEIQFSSVAPATGVDGEIEQDEMENETQSDSSSIRNDEDVDGQSDGATNDGKTAIANEVAEDGQSESNDSSVEASAPVVEKPSKGKKRVSSPEEPTTEDTTPRSEPANSVVSPPAEPYNTTNEESTDDDTRPQQFVLQVDVHTMPVRSEEAVSPSKMRKRVQHLQQQQSNSPEIQSAPLRKVLPSRSKVTIEPKKTLKRKSDTLKSSEGDDDVEVQPTKKLKTDNVSESSNKVAQRATKGRVAKTTEIEKPKSAERLTRQRRNMDDKNAADKETTKPNLRNVKDSKSSKGGPKQTASNTPTSSKNQVNKDNQTKRATPQKKTAPNEKPKTPAAKRSDTQPVSASKRSTRPVTVNVKNIPAKKSTPNKSSTVTPQTTLSDQRSTRQRLIASEPPAQKPKSKTGTKSSVTSKTEKERPPKQRSSLSNLNDAKSLDTPQHRTRRALAKEFLVNNVITRNRSSIDGVKLLENLQPTRRKSVGISLVEKPLSTKSAGSTTAVPLRRVRTLEKK
ncbi:condensin complex subunit 3-like isoform X2 [Bradysia coprophila]|uniref:condensin complex subunit 3-like isoform X2 n=1 Tax=Bradysia coprophila TaxID=38358 RepID=UPI00187D6EF8|nr:condensin complex subunit 3-like isoform X2 [Bradysia coprophila]